MIFQKPFQESRRLFLSGAELDEELGCSNTIIRTKKQITVEMGTAVKLYIPALAMWI